MGLLMRLLRMMLSIFYVLPLVFVLFIDKFIFLLKKYKLFFALGVICL